MATPPPPSFHTGTKKTVERTAKTPFQLGNLHQRNFKSELQPNRVSTRFYNENPAPKSSTRFYPSTCQRQPLRVNEEPKNHIVSRLGNFFKSRDRQPSMQSQIQETKHASQIQETKHASQISRAHSEPSIKYQVQVNNKSYKILRKIGSGGSAKVYEGFDPHTSQTFAIKIINVAQADQRTQESYFNEKAILAKLRDSKHVVHMYDSEYKAECKELIIVMEKGDADLSQVIDSYFKTNNRMIDGIFIKFYWRGMLQAVNEIHRHGIVHADLKPVNFILVKNEIKLIDFGIASTVEPEGTSVIRDYQIGTVNYMAPEALKNRATDASFINLNKGSDENNPHRTTVIKYNSKVDIWSLGCILYNLVYGRPPFDKYKDIVSKVQAITDSHHNISFPEISNRKLLNCITSCLRYNPSERPTAQELLDDPYLREDHITIQRNNSSAQRAFHAQ